ncbi:hypothetical protein ACFL4G_01185, partial [Thermodesulfobacteriota bacterium]
LRRYTSAGIELALWPLLPDEIGYWPNERNVDSFSAFVQEILDQVRTDGLRLPWIAIDMEPPIYQMDALKGTWGIDRLRTLASLARANRNRPRFEAASDRYRSLLGVIHRAGAKTLVPVLPILSHELTRNGQGLQDLLETPITGIGWDVISLMIYNSMLVGYSGERISWTDARWYLYSTCREMRRALGTRASVSVGLLSPAKLGDEPYYEDPDELRPDVQAAVAAGIADIAVYSLEGILGKKDPEAWLKTVARSGPAVPARSRRVDLVRALGGLITRLL